MPRTSLSPRASFPCLVSLSTPSRRPKCEDIISRMLMMTGMLLFTGIGAPCLAQVTMHQQALDALGPTPAKTPPQGPALSVHKHAPSKSHSSTNRKAAPSAGRSPAAPAPMVAPRPPTGHPAMAIVPAIPQAAPPPPVFQAPVINVPLHPEPLPPMPPVDGKSTGSAHIIANASHALRLLYPGSSTSLNTPMIKAIEAFAAALKTHPGTRALVNAYSSGIATDLSTPRRTSFMRGLAIRAVLVNAGIATTHVYVRAIGIPGPKDNNAPADRVDLFFSDIIPPAEEKPIGQAKSPSLSSSESVKASGNAPTSKTQPSNLH